MLYYKLGLIKRRFFICVTSLCFLLFRCDDHAVVSKFNTQTLRSFVSFLRLLFFRFRLLWATMKYILFPMDEILFLEMVFSRY